MKHWTERRFWEDRFIEGETPWELGGASPTVADLERRADLSSSSTVIVPGCGSGEDAIYFARMGYEVSAVDWASAAVNHLRAKARRQGLAVEALCSSVWEIPESWHGTFDVWVEHTFFCAIDPADREQYRDQVLKLLKPNGILIGAFFITKDPKARRVFPQNGGEGPPFWTTEAELRRLFEPHFEFAHLAVSPRTHPERKGLEWGAILRRRSSNC